LVYDTAAAVWYRVQQQQSAIGHSGVPESFMMKFEDLLYNVVFISSINVWFMVFYKKTGIYFAYITFIKGK